MGGGDPGLVGLGGQGGCERRIEVFVKIQKKNWGEGGQGDEGRGGERGRVGGQGGCDRRIEVFGKIHKKKHFGGGGGRSEGGGGRVGGGVGLGGGGVRLDVNEELKFL